MSLKTRVEALEKSMPVKAHTCEIVKVLADGSQETINTFQTTLPVDRILVKYGEKGVSKDVTKIQN